MWCWWFQRDLTALADGELSPRRAEAVRAHVAGCGECQPLLDQITHSIGVQRKLMPRLLSVTDLAVDPMLREVRLRLDDDSAPARRWIWQPALITGVAAVGLVLVSVLGLFTPLLVAVGLEEPPEQVAQQPELFRDYPLFEHLEALENFDALQAGTGGSTGAEQNE